MYFLNVTNNKRSRNNSSIRKDIIKPESVTTIKYHMLWIIIHSDKVWDDDGCSFVLCPQLSSYSITPQGFWIYYIIIHLTKCSFNKQPAVPWNDEVFIPDGCTARHFTLKKHNSVPHWLRIYIYNLTKHELEKLVYVSWITHLWCGLVLNIFQRLYMKQKLLINKLLTLYFKVSLLRKLDVLTIIITIIENCT